MTTTNIKEVNEFIQQLLDACIEYRKQLDDKNEEIARLRELLEWAETLLCNAEPPKHSDYAEWMGLVHKWRDQKHGLAPAPEEPVIQDSRITEPEKENDDLDGWTAISAWQTFKENCKPAIYTHPEWRELGPDEVIQEGDQMTRIDTLMDWINVDWKFVHCGKKSKDLGMYLFRTRRPLPKQEEMPLEKEIKRIEWYQNYSEATVHHAIADSIRYLRNEIQKLKEAR